MISSKDLRSVITLGSLVVVLLFSLLLSPLTGASPPTTFLISEVCYDGTTPSTEGDEFVEIYNPTASALDLSSYKIGDEETQGAGEGMYQFPPDTTIGPQGILVVAKNAAQFQARFGFDPHFELVTTGTGYTDTLSIPDLTKYTDWATGRWGLTNSGDEVLLLDGGDAIVDAMSYGNKTTFFDPPCPGVAAGHSLERSPANVDTDTAADWIDQESPTPGDLPTYTIYLPLVVKNY